MYERLSRACVGPRWRPFLTVTFLIASLVSRGVIARAQTPMAGDSIHAAKTLFTWRDAALAGGFAGVTVAMFPVDKRVAERLQDSSTQASHFLRNASRDLQYMADPGSIVIGGMALAAPADA